MTATFGKLMPRTNCFKASEYAPLIVAYRNGAAVRLSNLGQVIDSVEDTRNDGLDNGKPNVIVAIFRQPQANIIDTVDHVSAVLPAVARVDTAGHTSGRVAGSNGRLFALRSETSRSH